MSGRSNACRSVACSQRLIGAGCVVITFWCIASPVEAYGPGVHMIEASQVLDLLIESDPTWAEAAEDPMAISYLRFGSISPDLHQAMEDFHFSPTKDFAYYLIDQAIEEGPRHMMFALGHLCHICSDASAESFVVPALWGSAPIGMVDLFDDSKGAAGESETIVETYGDLIIGDWMAVVDTIFDFKLESDTAWDRTDEILTWYCLQGEAFSGRDSDCEAAVEDMAQTVAPADEYFSGMERDDAKAFVAYLLDRPPDGILTLMTSGALQSMIESLYGDQMVPSEHFRQEVVRVRRTELMDPAFWDQYYDVYTHLGPAWTLDHLEHRPPPGWPQYNHQAIICGNIQSVMQFLPDEYAVIPGLFVDRVRYTDGDGGALSEVTETQAESTCYAQVRFFSAVNLQGEIRGVVRRDHSGFGQDTDDIAGEATLEVDIDPTQYTVQPRSELEIPFTADTDGVLGFYLDLYLDDETRPWFTTSWDRLWTADQIDLDRDVYQDNFGTYGHWPPSLPIENPDVQPAVLFVKVRIAPAGLGIPDAQVVLETSETSATTGANGIAVFDVLQAGAETVWAQAEGYEDPEESAQVELVGLQHSWVEFVLHAIPVISFPGDYWPDRTTLIISWNAELFGDQVDTYLAQAFETGSETALSEEVELGSRSPAEMLFDPPLQDGIALQVHIQPRYLDDTMGLEAWSPSLVIDGSGPDIEHIDLSTEPLSDCIDDPEQVPFAPVHTVSVLVDEPHSPVTAISWRIGDTEWNTVPADLPGDVMTEPIEVLFEVDPVGYPIGEPLYVRIANAAGLEAQSDPLELTVWDESQLCPPEQPDEPEPTEEPPPRREEDDGCSLVAHRHQSWVGPIVLSVLLLACRIGRRRSSCS